MPGSEYYDCPCGCGNHYNNCYYSKRMIDDRQTRGVLSYREKDIIVNALEKTTDLLARYLKRIQKLERQVKTLQKRKARK